MLPHTYDGETRGVVTRDGEAVQQSSRFPTSPSLGDATGSLRMTVHNVRDILRRLNVCPVFLVDVSIKVGSCWEVCGQETMRCVLRSRSKLRNASCMTSCERHNETIKWGVSNCSSFH